MFKRLMFLIHLIVWIWTWGMAYFVFRTWRLDNGLTFFDPEFITTWIFFLGPILIFYLIDYVLVGKGNLTPWSRNR